MNLSDHKSAIAWAGGAVVFIGGIIGGWDQIAEKWNALGWITRTQYAVDHVQEATGERIIDSIDALKEQVAHVSADVAAVGAKVEGFETLWNCDELDEGLPGLRRWRDNAEGTDRWYEADQHVRSAEDRFDDLNCSELLEK